MKAELSSLRGPENEYIWIQSQVLRGRRPVRADHRLHTDEKRVRAQSAILIKNPSKSVGLSITVFLVRMRFSSVPKTRSARAARNGRWANLYEHDPERLLATNSVNHA
ncbi:MAG: hypothetical protein JJE42_06990 [Burkholderiales bacterium]|nr:hypothetical protein [Burkholderiales bacterium]